MSQVKFKSPFAGKRVEIMAGWDRPLQHYFLTVFDLDAGDDDPETYWSTLDHPDPHDNIGTERLEAQLRSMGIPAPEGFWERVHRQEGNVNHDFKDGAWESY